MTLSESQLRKYSKEYELKESRKLSLTPHSLSVLEALLHDVYSAMLPEKSDYERRGRVVRMCDEMAKSVFGNANGFPVTEALGSFIMDMFTSASDLDLSLNFDSHDTSSFSRDQKASTLRKFAQALRASQRKGQVRNVLPILKARVPIIKFIDQETGIECDISVENKDGITKSVIIHLLSLIDERFRILCFLMKLWAKTHGINCSKSSTLNSLSIIQLVAFHLQTRNPPILPPLSALLKDGTNLAKLQGFIPQFKNFGRANKETIAELFISLLNKLSSVETLWEHGLCASIFKGAWISKQWVSGVGIISVEDFTDHSENTARAVKKDEFKKIYRCIRSAVYKLSLLVKGQVNACDLKSFLFGEVGDSKMPSLKRHSPFNDSAGVEPPTKKIKKGRFYENVHSSSSSISILQNNDACNQHRPYRSPQLFPGLSDQKHQVQWHYGSQYGQQSRSGWDIENPHNRSEFKNLSGIGGAQPIPSIPQHFQNPHPQSVFERFAEIYGTIPISSQPQRQLKNPHFQSGSHRFNQIYRATPIRRSHFSHVLVNTYGMDPRLQRP